MYQVMIVDDIEIFRRSIKRLKVWGENSGFIISDEAVDGLDAVEKLEKAPVDLVITDIKMPRMDGMELLRTISEKKLCPYVVLLSDYTEYYYARQGFIYGAFDYIGKPVEEDELVQVLGRISKQLDEKLQEERRLEELHQIAEEPYFTDVDIKMIVDRISNAEIEEVRTLITESVNNIEKSLNQEENKASIIVKNMMKRIMNGILNYYPWIPLYYNVNSLYNISFTNCLEVTEIKEAVIKNIEDLISSINLFIRCRDNKMVKDICSYVLINIDEKLSVKVIAERMYVSKAHLSEVFKQKMGLTLLEYITLVKMERAKKLLLESGLKNYEIAYQLGFRDNEYFNKVFKKYAAMSLTEFRLKKDK